MTAPAPQDPETALKALDAALEAAKAMGADAADAVYARGESLSAAVRLGATETFERAESAEMGLRVFVGARHASVSTTDLRADTLRALAERAVAMARIAPEDADAGLAPDDQIMAAVPAGVFADAVRPDAAALVEAAMAAEEAARAVKGVTNSEGAEAGWSNSLIALAATNGFRGGYERSRHSISASVLAADADGRMERDYDYAIAVRHADLDAAASVGAKAGERTVARLGAQRVQTMSGPVVFAPRVAGGLVSSLAGAANGASVARGSSFLKDKMGEAVMAAGLTIIDDPQRAFGLRSRPFDGEGLPAERLELVADGVLQCWLLDQRSARRLGLRSNGRAARGVAGSPSPSATNLYLAPGTITPEALVADIDDGVYVTELMGMGVNPVTGDYSRGASGFVIRNGQIGHPFNEATIAGNLKEMYRALTPANDLQHRYGVDAPTIRIDAMTIAGG